jgi:ribonucleoside-triphosphate reductase
MKQIQKRNGAVVPFNLEKIVTAVHKAMLASKTGSEKEAEVVAKKVYLDLVRMTKKHDDFIPTVEGVQDVVEKELILGGHAEAAKAFILYREERAQLRAAGIKVPPHVKKLSKESKQYFRNSLGEFVYYRTYSRWMDDEHRRETWVETVNRYMAFMRENLGGKLTEKEYREIRTGILEQGAMPSMRLLQFAGTAARKTNVCAYNCSYIAPGSFQDLAEIMYISMCGTGVGWSVESRNVERFPQIKPQAGKKVRNFVVPDSKEGWADALALGMRTWAQGGDIAFDYSGLRPAGSRLKVMGGKASGPEPLQRLMAFTREKMLGRQGRRLRTIDVHDIICMIGDCVVAGGVRRSAMISLSDLDDADIRAAKSGAFYLTNPQRMLSNNSAVYSHKPSNVEFLEEWTALMKSGSGERGIFNRGGLKNTLPKRRLKKLKGHMESLGTNPCGEIILRSKQFCNLSEVVARKEDTEATLMKKVRLAAMLGTYQASLTDFSYLSKEWKENCEAERLLGVSITGQWDCPLTQDPKILERLRDEAIKVNQEYSKRFGVNQSTCVTCVKPSGTLSQMTDCASGMHPRHAPYYIRRIRIAATDALFKMLKDQGVPYHPEVGQSIETATTYVLEFPVKAPEGSVFKNSLTALEQLEHWKLVKTHYTEHNPSVTISVGDNEWIAVGNWVYENWDMVGGLSFLPRDNHVYPLAPYEEITKERYLELSKQLAHIDYSKIVTYEQVDDLDLKKELACSAGVCEIM